MEDSKKILSLQRTDNSISSPYILRKNFNKHFSTIQMMTLTEKSEQAEKRFIHKSFINIISLTYTHKE